MDLSKFKLQVSTARSAKPRNTGQRTPRIAKEVVKLPEFCNATFKGVVLDGGFECDIAESYKLVAKAVADLVKSNPVFSSLYTGRVTSVDTEATLIRFHVQMVKSSLKFIVGFNSHRKYVNVFTTSGNKIYYFKWDMGVRETSIEIETVSDFTDGDEPIKI